jgi:hypothetical protein
MSRTSAFHSASGLDTLWYWGPPASGKHGWLRFSSRKIFAGHIAADPHGAWVEEAKPRIAGAGVGDQNNDLIMRS